MTPLIRILRLILGSDVVAATFVILIATTLTATVWFCLAWLSYRERYGISFTDFLEITF